MKKKEKKIHQFKITLKDVDPPIWRRIHVRSDISLHRLSTTVLIAMDWSGGHLRQFKIDGKFYGMPCDEFESGDEPIDERNVLLQSLSHDKLKTFGFEYDFGDGWRHSVELEKVLDPEKGRKYPICIGGARKCPPDDCGGTDGYEDFLEAIKNPNHPEHRSMSEWIGYKFDPEVFCLDSVNSNLRDVSRTEKIWWDKEDE